MLNSPTAPCPCAEKGIPTAAAGLGMARKLVRKSIFSFFPLKLPSCQTFFLWPPKEDHLIDNFEGLLSLPLWVFWLSFACGGEGLGERKRGLK